MKKTYQEALDHLFNAYPMYQRVGQKALKPNLDNISKLCQLLSQPQNKFPSIHIAGTNGKGTTTHMLSSIFQSSGLKVGIYTSPHYVDFRERVKVNGALISKDFIIKFTERLIVLDKDITPSFFEMTVALAFTYFEYEKVDIAIIETGLGGRFDSTNIIDPELSVITNISLDHQSILGNTIYQIAHEKAGIIKNDRAVVIGNHQVACDAVFIKKADQTKSDISFASLNWEVEKSDESYHFKYKKKGNFITLKLNQINPFTLENMCTTLEAYTVFQTQKNEAIDLESIQKGLENFESISNYIGRWKVLAGPPNIIADSAHNHDGIKRTLNFLSTHHQVPIVFVLGFVGGKDITSILGLFKQHQLSDDATFVYTQPASTRAFAVEDLMGIANKLGIKGKGYGGIREALDHAKGLATSKHLIYVGGSSYLVGDLLSSITE